MKAKLILFCLLFSFALQAQEKEYNLITQNYSYGLSFLDIADSYLSPLRYDGDALRFQRESRQFFRDRTDLSSYNSFLLMGGSATNPANTAVMMLASMNLGYGIHYHFYLNDNMRILAGGIWDFDLGFKMISRNVNNPANLDLATNLNLSGIFRLLIPTSKRTMLLDVSIQNPFIGCMFIPENGATYYEMFTIDSSQTKMFHLSSLHNRVGYKAGIAFCFPLKKTTWRAQFNYQNLRYTANNAFYLRNELSFSIGCSYDIYRFSGRTDKAPENFNSTND